MTKWKRLRKLREKKRFEAEVLRPKAEGEEVKQTNQKRFLKTFNNPKKLKSLEALKLPSQRQFLLKFLDMFTCWQFLRYFQAFFSH